MAKRYYWLLAKEEEPEWVVVMDPNQVSCEFKVYYIQGFDYDGTRDAQDIPLCGSDHWSEESSTTVKGFIKWDGCSDFEAGGHFCDGAESYVKLSHALTATFNLAYEGMTSFPDSHIEWGPEETEFYGTQEFTPNPKGQTVYEAP